MIFTVAIAGCSSKQTAGVTGTLQPNSKFSKISIGMPMKQVFDLIGEPTDRKIYTTGKAWIPIYFGSDCARCEALYKVEGRITFTGGAGFGGGAFKAYSIVHDPTEAGYNR